MRDQGLRDVVFAGYVSDADLPRYHQTAHLFCAPNTGNESQGIVLLDGSWAQAKALWWRNPWLLKLRRLVLNPRRPSRYGDLRREPRRGALSTLEAAALTLSELARDPTIETRLVAPFGELLRRYRASGGEAEKSERPTAPRRRWRGKRRRSN